MATDVLGRVVEVVSGRALDAFVADRVLDPLGMTDTRWWVDEADADRLAALYTPGPTTGRAVRLDALAKAALRPPRLLSGGGGLVSSAADYHRFTQMLLGRGALNGTRVLGPRTVGYMTRNHLPGRRDLAELSTGGFAETTFEGTDGAVLHPAPSLEQLSPPRPASPARPPGAGRLDVRPDGFRPGRFVGACRRSENNQHLAVVAAAAEHLIQ